MTMKRGGPHIFYQSQELHWSHVRLNGVTNYTGIGYTIPVHTDACLDALHCQQNVITLTKQHDQSTQAQQNRG